MVRFSRAKQRALLVEVHLPQEQEWSEELNDPQGVPIPDDDASHWDVFIPDDDEIDPLPEPGDFWIEPEDEQRAESMERGAESVEQGAESMEQGAIEWG
jgi:hypothetical protein